MEPLDVEKIAARNTNVDMGKLKKQMEFLRNARAEDKPGAGYRLVLPFSRTPVVHRTKESKTRRK